MSTLSSFEIKIADQIKIVPVPDYIFRSFLRNSKTAADMSDYGCVMSTLSINDVAEWLDFYTSAKVRGAALINNDIRFEDVFKIKTPEQKKHFHDCQLVSASLSSLKSLEVRMGKANVNSGFVAPDNKGYRFILVGDILYALFNEGHAPKSFDEQKAFEFVKDYMKATLQRLSVEQASTLPVNRLYLEYLSKA